MRSAAAQKIHESFKKVMTHDPGVFESAEIMQQLLILVDQNF
jgi:hypothetical protein